MASKDDEVTHFGFKQVPVAEKASKVADVFHSVAERYDLMNDLMSLGSHRVMKQMAANATRARPGHMILDLAGGTGDLTVPLSEYVEAEGQVCICDINGSMLREGRDRLLNRGIVGNVSYAQADGEKLPFPEETFNSVIIGFGLRNFTSKETALKDIYRCLKPAGKLVILEFSKPKSPLVKNVYRGFSSLWPKVGKLITGDEESYSYLVESIEMHPDQETLREMIETEGFTRVRYQNLLNGIAAIHEGMKPRAS
jgi:demethylmenaquinone methyltransferase/2-methoxy-6-polyprenyl-1,4-benzoquinol methylase